MKFIAKTLYGLEEVLAAELRELGVSEVKPVNRAVSFSGSRETMYRVNYCVRTALSVLLHVSGFRIRSKEDLYRKASEVDWSTIMDADSTFSVVPVVNSKIFEHTGYPGLVVKDAIVDYFRKLTGRRPVVDSDNPGVIVNLHISNDSAEILQEHLYLSAVTGQYRLLPPLMRYLQPASSCFRNGMHRLPLQIRCADQERYLSKQD